MVCACCPDAWSTVAWKPGFFSVAADAAAAPFCVPKLRTSTDTVLGSTVFADLYADEVEVGAGDHLLHERLDLATGPRCRR